ncbi:transient receptor potential cation channel subfamily M member 7-like [Saccostrea cucullata]|uniref:transient receptor potential cation channel subfamily M member 7-like n=1 Tax=Saccostrea cuccullata TaxID=36930 RepID=UPI002ED3A522
MHMLKEKARKPLQGKDIAVRLMEKIPLYMTSLPVQVLKAGHWNFPGSYVMETLDKIFDQNSIQYIFEKNMEEEFKNGMWEDLKETTESAYQPPNFADKKLELSKDCRILDLVFYALLKTKRLDGARQLLETGCVGIRPILIGCKILKDFSEDWRVGILEEKELDRLRRMFGRHALSIMNYIHEKDEKDKPEEPKDLSEKVMTFFFKKKDDVNNAGRLLLNHGYLDVAYKTENEWFLENSKLKTIIKELWKGKGYKKQGRRWAMTTTFLLFLLHVFIMPLLLVNLDKPPLTWFYKKYHTPILKLWINMVGVFFFLAAFAYMLLFDYSEETVSRSELAILFWVACKFVDELEQVIVAIKRKKQIPDAVKMYLSDTWNHLDWLIIIACTLGAILKLFDDNLMEGAAKLLYISAYVMLNIRILNMFWTSEFLGTQLVIIQKMFGNTVAFMAIVLVIMMCYNVVDHALLFPNTEFSWAEVESIIKNGYWTLYGEFGDDVGTDCTNNATIYKAGLQERCPTSLGSAISPYLRAVYCLIAVVMLLNLLIAIYSYTAAIVHENSRMHWSQLQSNFLEEYTIRNIFPIHFKLLSAAAFVIHLVLSPVLKCVTNKKGQPAYERVLLYDESYDVIQKETEEAEKNGILEMQGKLEIDTDQFPEEMEPLKDEMKEIKREMKELKEDMKV